MKEHKREDWRICKNCFHRAVCEFKSKDGPLECEHHIYDADPKRYGDLQELIEPVCEWIATHYPSDGQLVVDKYSATVIMPVHGVYSTEYLPEYLQPKRSDAE